jgi:hypothetical protein
LTVHYILWIVFHVYYNDATVKTLIELLLYDRGLIIKLNAHVIHYRKYAGHANDNHDYLSYLAILCVQEDKSKLSYLFKMPSVCDATYTKVDPGRGGGRAFEIKKF